MVCDVLAVLLGAVCVLEMRYATYAMIKNS